MTLHHRRTETLSQQAISPDGPSQTKPDRAEHEAEKTDTILAGLAIRYIRNRSTTGVVVLTDDQPAGKGIENAVRAQGLHGYDHGLRLDGHHRRRSRRLGATDLAEQGPSFEIPRLFTGGATPVSSGELALSVLGIPRPRERRSCSLRCAGCDFPVLVRYAHEYVVHQQR